MPDDNSGKTYLAIDIGAESGRVIAGHLYSGNLVINELHRFANEPIEYGGSLHWDIPRLWLEIQRGLHAEKHERVDGIAVDTWGVDYALLGERGDLLENPYHYRDGRTTGMIDAVCELVPREEVYAATGIQFMPINTLYQLFAAKSRTPRLLEAADMLLTIPDLFHYWLSGNAVCEFTNATTTQMIDPRTRSWATNLLDKLGLPSTLPGPLVEPGEVIGKVQPQASQRHAGTLVIAPASHDTGSAVAAVDARGDTAFLSSGTWSLVGTELDAPIINDDARRLNFTNEGGVCGTTRFLKNVMGLWMMQRCRKSFSDRGFDRDYGEMTRLAIEEPALQQLVNPDDGRFLRPDCMLSAIDSFCEDTDQAAPKNPGAYIRLVLESLALKYRLVIRDLEQLTGREIKQIRIIGGGSKNDLLNQFTADATGRRVLAGPAEATALGNVAVQMLATGATSSLAESRSIIDRSFRPQILEPHDTTKWDAHVKRFEQYCEVTRA
jgi:rhamnulokinase